DYDILALQEPYLTFLNLTSSTSHWHVIYPSTHRKEGAGRSRAVTLVNKKLSIDSWSTIATKHPDITTVSIRSADATVHVFNVY
ncbi:uncharacterized protein TRAVEDRAFT_104381, partial [Trametes versicolor FP-101664 SS1]|uniref:uncharacterized protein n=1 Tax=Trametes versicolor (strain FP-101664) TaxID=717944 RepID=UPI00046223DE